MMPVRMENSRMDHQGYFLLSFTLQRQGAYHKLSTRSMSLGLFYINLPG